MAPSGRDMAGGGEEDATSLGDDKLDRGEESDSSRGVTQVDGRFSLFIDGISDAVSFSRIRDLFSQYGCIRKMFVQSQRRPRRRCRFGFVHMSSFSKAVVA